MATTTIAQQTGRTSILLTASIVLIWFMLILGGSVFGTFAQYPPVFFLVVGGPVVLYVGAYLLLATFRR
jgi:hypothetical protein